jgi:branched-chain amino acid transport system ATP-binding protein
VTLLDVRDLRTGYGRMEVVHGIDFHVDAGEVVVILGANGAGKTTTLRALSGMLPSSGRIEFRDRALGRRRSPDRVARMGMAHVPQGRGTIVDLTVEENLAVGAYTVRDRSSVRGSIARWYELFPHLAARRESKAGSLSGGEQQMLAVARALIAEPALLLLDEPSLGLAPIVARDLYEHLALVARESNVSMLVVEQNASLALGLADRGYVMESGTVATAGSADELRSTDSIRRAYLGV